MDLFLTNGGWLGDLALTVSGDLQTCTGTVQGQQRVIRRVLTAPGGLLFHPNYGFGLTQKIGAVQNAASLAGQLKAQIFMEAAVSQNPGPSISVVETPVGSGREYANVTYTDATSGSPQLLVFDVSQGPPTTTP
jgi:hypothetical protein